MGKTQLLKHFCWCLYVSDFFPRIIFLFYWRKRVTVYCKSKTYM